MINLVSRYPFTKLSISPIVVFPFRKQYHLSKYLFISGIFHLICLESCKINNTSTVTCELLGRVYWHSFLYFLRTVEPPDFSSSKNEIVWDPSYLFVLRNLDIFLNFFHSKITCFCFPCIYYMNRLRTRSCILLDLIV